MSVRYKAKHRLRYYVRRQVCQKCGGPHAIACFLPEPPRLIWSHGRGSERAKARERAPDEVLCRKHAQEAGYCRSCGDFWAGIESFDFGHPGLCDHCYDQVRADEAWDEEPDDDYYAALMELCQ